MRKDNQQKQELERYLIFIFILSLDLLKKKVFKSFSNI
jgi:hypothetical protein